MFSFPAPLRAWLFSLHLWIKICDAQVCLGGIWLWESSSPSPNVQRRQRASEKGFAFAFFRASESGEGRNQSLHHRRRGRPRVVQEREGERKSRQRGVKLELALLQPSIVFFRLDEEGRRASWYRGASTKADSNQGHSESFSAATLSSGLARQQQRELKKGGREPVGR